MTEAVLCNAPGPRVLADLLGKWRFERWIDDRRAGQGIAVVGEARLHAQASGYAYDEAAEMQVPGHAPLRSTRRYLLEDGGDHAAFFFEDGRYFHRMDFRHADATCHHACPPDSYDVRYDFADWPAWSATWSVTGPRKDYVMTTRYRRAGGD